ncbi:MAG: OmpA family protein, partial [Bacteroidetes bacterium]|nr:OmpA family protein [Bacteroidota bacterium]
IHRELLYTDLRFILKGKTLNRNSHTEEPYVLVSLTKKETGSVQQDNSNGEGSFVFRLDQESNYEIAGSKENRLSDIEKASTIGLKRSKTLFVDLQLGMDNLDCGQGTTLDIKYEFNKSALTDTSKSELDRLVLYLKDHPEAKVKLSSHTDSRGSDEYNLNLSIARAKSAVDYIISQGISSYRIIAKGYGERRLLNGCADGVNCSESEHLINRRTEAALICQ